MFLQNTQQVRLIYGSHFLFLPPLEKAEGKEVAKTEFAENDTDETLAPENIEVKKDAMEIVSSVPEKTEVPKTEEKKETPKEIVMENFKKTDSSVFETGSQIAWKKRVTAKFFVIVSASDFSNRMLMIVLREFIKESEISLEAINFGIYPNDTQSWNVSDMPLPIGIVFSEHLQFAESAEKVGGKTVYAAPDLLQIVQKPMLQNAFNAVLKEVMDLI